MALEAKMIGPGEGEVSAGKRLLERVMRRYGRFFNVILADALSDPDRSGHGTAPRPGDDGHRRF